MISPHSNYTGSMADTLKKDKGAEDPFLLSETASIV